MSDCSAMHDTTTGHIISARICIGSDEVSCTGDAAVAWWTNVTMVTVSSTAHREPTASRVCPTCSVFSLPCFNHLDGNPCLYTQYGYKWQHFACREEQLGHYWYQTIVSRDINQLKYWNIHKLPFLRDKLYLYLIMSNKPQWLFDIILTTVCFKCFINCDINWFNVF